MTLVDFALFEGNSLNPSNDYIDARSKLSHKLTLATLVYSLWHEVINPPAHCKYIGCSKALGCRNYSYTLCLIYHSSLWNFSHNLIGLYKILNLCKCKGKTTLKVLWILIFWYSAKGNVHKWCPLIFDPNPPSLPPNVQLLPSNVRFFGVILNPPPP